MSDQPISLVVIVGSARRGRTAGTVAAWFVSQARLRQNLAVTVLDLADIVLPGEPCETPPASAAAALRDSSAVLAAADAFVVVTPEYNHSFPASLKSFIDWHFSEWHAKPVAFVSYGGISAGLRAVEQLRQVFPEVHAVTIRDTVCFQRVWDMVDADGNLAGDAGCDAAAASMLDHLEWWALALRDARDRRPFIQVSHQVYSSTAGK